MTVVVPEIALAKIRADAPFDKVCYIGCGVTTGVGAVLFTAQVEPGANVVVFGLGGIGLNVIQGARMVGADKIIGIDLNPAREAMGRKFGMTHFVNPKEVSGDLVAHIVELTGGGADYSFECVGNPTLMRQALECAHKGWGVSTIIGVAAAGDVEAEHGTVTCPEHVVRDTRSAEREAHFGPSASRECSGARGVSAQRDTRRRGGDPNASRGTIASIDHGTRREIVAGPDESW